VTSSPRQEFRVLDRIRHGYQGAVLYDVQLQRVATGELLWSRTFSSADEARVFLDAIDEDLRDLDLTSFRRKYGVPSGV